MAACTVPLFILIYFLFDLKYKTKTALWTRRRQWAVKFESDSKTVPPMQQLHQWGTGMHSLRLIEKKLALKEYKPTQMSLLTSSSTIFNFECVCESVDGFGNMNLLQLDHKECK